jgi:hypothetical protein
VDYDRVSRPDAGIAAEPAGSASEHDSADKVEPRVGGGVLVE